MPFISNVCTSYTRHIRIRFTNVLLAQMSLTPFTNDWSEYEAEVEGRSPSDSRAIEQALREEVLRKDEIIRTLESEKADLARQNLKLQEAEVTDCSRSRASAIDHAARREVGHKNEEIQRLKVEKEDLARTVEKLRASTTKLAGNMHKFVLDAEKIIGSASTRAAASACLEILKTSKSRFENALQVDE